MAATSWLLLASGLLLLEVVATTGMLLQVVIATAIVGHWARVLAMPTSSPWTTATAITSSSSIWPTWQPLIVAVPVATISPSIATMSMVTAPRVEVAPVTTTTEPWGKAVEPWDERCASTSGFVTITIARSLRRHR